MKTKHFKSRHALLMSLTSLTLCVSMLFGATFAWFTDSVTSGVNRIVSGNLDVELYHTNHKQKTEEKVDALTTLFDVAANDSTILWEPGAMSYEIFTVKNEGTLALKYQMNLNTVDFNTVTWTDTAKGSHDLRDVLKIAVLKDGTAKKPAAAEFKAWSEFKAKAAFSGDLAAKGAEGDSETYAVYLWWPDTNSNDVDNLYNLNNASKNLWSLDKKNTSGEGIEDSLYVDLGVVLTATQKDSESDSFDSTYDAGLNTADVVVASATSGTSTLSASSATTLTALAAPSTKENITTVTIPAGALTTAGDKPDTAYVTVETTNDTSGFTASTTGSGTVATIDVTLYVNDQATTTENNALTTGAYTVATYITKGLSNVTLTYGDTEAWNATATSEAGVSGYTAYYDATTGKLVFQTTHFSEFTVAGAAEAYIAETDTAYGTLAGAVSDAKEGETVVMLADITGQTQMLKIHPEHAITLDGNGHTISGNYQYPLVELGGSISEAKNLKVINGSSTANVSYCLAVSKATVTLNNVEATTYAGMAFVATDAAKVTLNNCDFQSKLLSNGEKNGSEWSWLGSALMTQYDSTVTVNSGNYTSECCAAAYIASSGGKLTIQGGTFSAPYALVNDGVKTKFNYTHATLTVSDGTFNGNISAGFFCTNGARSIPATLEINGGTFNGYQDDDLKIYVNNGAQASITGNPVFSSFDVSIDNFDHISWTRNYSTDNNGTKLTISGGTFGNDVSEYCTNGYEAVPSGGKYVVQAVTYWKDYTEAYTTAEDGTILIANAKQLAKFAADVNGGNNFSGKTVQLTADIDLSGHVWTPAGNVTSYPSIAFKGTFDGNNHTISDMSAKDSAANWASAGFFGSVSGATIKDVTFKNAKVTKVTSSHYAGVVVGYEASNLNKTHIQNVTVEGATVISTPELLGDGEYDNGDKAGGIVGYATATIVTNCVVKNTTIKAYRDIGGIFGCADGTYGAAAKNCKIENVTLTVDNTHNYKKYESLAAHNVANFIGRNLQNAEDDGNTGNATIVSPYTA